MAQKAIITDYPDGSRVISNLRNKKGIPFFKDNDTYTATRVTEWYDGTLMDDSKVDGVVYLKHKLSGEYYLVNLPNWGQYFLEKDTVADLRAMSSTEILLLKMGYYKGVKLNGYYAKNDTPAPIEYYLSDTVDLDDGGSVFEVGGIKLEHEFVGEVHIGYFGAQDNADFTSTLSDIFSKYKVVSGSKNITFSISSEVLIPDNGVLKSCSIKILNYTGACFFISSGGKVHDNTFWGTGVKATNSMRKCCLFSTGNRDISIYNNSFYEFKAEDHNSNCGLITLESCHGIKISGNYFDKSNYGFNDIDTAYLSGDCIYSDNISYSNCDVFISTTSVGKDVNLPDTNIPVIANHIINSNIHIKNRWESSDEPLGRHGVLAHYAGGVSRVIATSNIIGNTSRHGFYLRGADDAGVTTGDDILSNNIILYCGRGDISNYCSGIRCENTRGAIISNNIVSFSGYDLDNVKTPQYDAYAIECIRGMDNVIIEGNKIDNYKSGAIRIAVQNSNKGISNVKVVGNIIKGDVSGISFEATASNNYIENILVNGNSVSIDNGSCLFTEISASTISQGGFVISNNTFSGSDINEPSYGVSLDTNGLNLLRPNILNNIFTRLNTGIGSYRQSSNTNEYFPDRIFGVKNNVDFNQFIGCKYALQILRGTSGRMALVGRNNTFSGNTNNGVTDSYSSYECNIGSVLTSRFPSGEIVELIANTTPNFDTKVEGDRVIVPVPISDIGWVCTSSSTNTWSSLGQII